MAVTSWDSEGMVWSDNLRDRLLYPYIEALRKALIERANAVDVSVPAILDVSLTNQIPQWDWAHAWDDLFDDVLGGSVVAGTNFVDQTQMSSAGHWDNNSTEPPEGFWSKVALQDEVSEGLNLVSGVYNGGMIFSGSWAYAAYNALNLLTLSLLDYDSGDHDFSSSFRDGRSENVHPANDTYQKAKDAWDLLSWSSTGGQAYGRVKQTAGGAYGIDRGRVGLTLEDIPTCDGCDRKGNCYLFIETSVHEASYAWNWDNPDYPGIDEDRWFRVPGAVDFTVDEADTEFSFTYGDFETHGFDEPAAGEGRGWQILNYPHRPLLFLDWGIVGGFNFLD